MFPLPSNMFCQQVLDCQIHEPLQLAQCPDENILFGSSGFLRNCFPDYTARMISMPWELWRKGGVKTTPTACDSITAVLYGILDIIVLRAGLKKDKLGEAD